MNTSNPVVANRVGVNIDAADFETLVSMLNAYAKKADMAAYALLTEVQADEAVIAALQSALATVQTNQSTDERTLASVVANQATDETSIKANSDALSQLAGRVSALEKRVLSASVGSAVATLQLALNATTTVTIPFTTPMPDTAYALDYAMAAGSVSLLAVSVSKVAKSATGVTLTLKNSGAALTATVTFTVFAVRYA